MATSLPQGSRPDPKLAGKTIWEPKRSTAGPVNFLLSGRDRSIYVYRNGILIGQSPVGIRNPEKPLPAGVFLMLDGTDPKAKQLVKGRESRPWTALALDEGEFSGSVEDIRQRLVIPEDFGKKIYELAKPGTILLTTASPRSDATQSKPDFTIMRPQD